MGIFTSLFGGGKPDESQEDRQKRKNFEILKYDGIRARNIRQLPYAIQCFEEAVALQEDTETMSLLASAYMQAERTEEACRVLNRICEKEPGNITALLSLAGIYDMQQDYSAMASICQKALQADPAHATALYMAGKAAHALHNDLQAIAMLTQATMQNETFAEAYLLRAEVLWSMRQAKDALEDIERVLALNANEEQAILTKGEIKAAAGDAAEAFHCFDRVTELNPFNENAYLLKGALLVEQKEFDKAIETYEEAMELMPEHAGLYRERGRARLLKGDKEGSMEDLKKAIELNPESETRLNGSFKNFDYTDSGKVLP